jgi:hypothetical protein
MSGNPWDDRKTTSCANCACNCGRDPRHPAHVLCDSQSFMLDSDGYWRTMPVDVCHQGIRMPAHARAWREAV